jgi:hypothetical protein
MRCKNFVEIPVHARCRNSNESKNYDPTEHLLPLFSNEEEEVPARNLCHFDAEKCSGTEEESKQHNMKKLL